MFRSLKLDKYFINRVIFMTTLAILGSIFYTIINYSLDLWLYLILLPIITLFLHFNLNTLHQASHRLLSKNKKLNSVFGHISAIFGGVSFATFQSTHFLHHANSSDPEKDPDYKITKSRSFFIIPFKIWYQDRYYWQNQLWKKYNSRLEYFIDRFAQVMIVTALFLSGNIWVFMYFWLVPTYVVGFMNGLFLFYFPHYSTVAERNWRQQSDQNLNLFQKLSRNISLLFIDISRFYHEKHHDRTQENKNFYPVEMFLYTKITNPKSSLAYTADYIDVNGYIG